MMKYYYVGLGILLIAAIIFGIIKTPKSNPTQIAPKENPYLGLRNMILSIDAKSLGQDISDPKQPLCASMDWEISGNTATLVTVFDGTTSLYLSTGGGFLGGGAHKSVSDVSSVFLEDSKTFLKFMKKDEEHALPTKGHVFFYVVTIDGVYKYDGKESEMASGKDPLSKLFTDGQNVITELGKISK